MTTFNNKLSIFIPHVLSDWANEHSISIIFKKLDIGEVERVDFVEKKTNIIKFIIMLSFTLKNGRIQQLVAISKRKYLIRNKSQK